MKKKDEYSTDTTCCVRDGDPWKSEAKEDHQLSPSGPSTRRKLGISGLPQFFVKKPKIFENVKSERGAANFQKSRTPHASTIISENSQIKGIKNMLAGSIFTMNMIQHYFCLIIMNQKLINF